MKKIFNKQTALRFLNSDYFLFGGLLCLILGYIKVYSFFLVTQNDPEKALPKNWEMALSLFLSPYTATIFVIGLLGILYYTDKKVSNQIRLSLNSKIILTGYLLCFIIYIPNEIELIYFSLVLILIVCSFIFSIIIILKSIYSNIKHQESLIKNLPPILLGLFLLPFFIFVISFETNYQAYYHFYQNQTNLEKIITKLKKGNIRCINGKLNPNIIEHAECNAEKENIYIIIPTPYELGCGNTPYIVFRNSDKIKLSNNSTDERYISINKNWYYSCKE